MQFTYLKFDKLRHLLKRDSPKMSFLRIFKQNLQGKQEFTDQVSLIMLRTFVVSKIADML